MGASTFFFGIQKSKALELRPRSALCRLLALSGPLIAMAPLSLSRHAAAERPRHSLLAASGRSVKLHQTRAPMLRRAAPSDGKTSTSTTSASNSAPPSPPPTSTISSAVVGQILPFRAPTSARRVQAPPDSPTLVILPGFGNAAEDYRSSSPTSTSSAPPPSIAAALESRGFSVAVVPVRRSDWLRVARCAVDPAYWRGEAEPETVSSVKSRRERERVRKEMDG